MEFQDKVVVITGGTSGIGSATVKLFVKEGAKVVFTGTNENKAKRVLGELSGPGCAFFKKTDVSVEKEVKDLADFVASEVGKCEILFNNAGIHCDGKLHETDPKTWDRVIAVDLRGVYLCSYYFIPHMLEIGHGVIINMSSVSGVRADYGMAAYNAAKGAVTNLTRAMALDYADKGIRVNAVCPGAVRTEMLEKTFRKVGWERGETAFLNAYPPHRIAEPEEIASVVLFLASERASFINGANILIDGGITAHTGQPRFD